MHLINLQVGAQISDHDFCLLLKRPTESCHGQEFAVTAGGDAHNAMKPSLDPHLQIKKNRFYRGKKQVLFFQRLYKLGEKIRRCIKWNAKYSTVLQNSIFLNK